MLKKIVLATLIFGCINTVAYGMEDLHRAIREYGAADANMKDYALGEIKKLVVAAPSTVTDVNEFSNTSLHLASGVNGNSKVVSILLDAVPYVQQRVAFVMAKNVYGNTALHMALRIGDVNIAKLLTESIPVAHRDAFVVTKNAEDKTAVHLAEEHSHSNVVIEFLAYCRFYTTK